MKATNELISRKEAIADKMQIVKVYNMSSLFAVPLTFNNLYINVSNSRREDNRRIEKKYKRIPVTSNYIKCA